jgi:hypothetical protein
VDGQSRCRGRAKKRRPTPGTGALGGFGIRVGAEAWERKCGGLVVGFDRLRNAVGVAHSCSSASIIIITITIAAMMKRD